MEPCVTSDYLLCGCFDGEGIKTGALLLLLVQCKVCDEFDLSIVSFIPTMWTVGGSGKYREPQELLTLGHTHTQTNKRKQVMQSYLITVAQANMNVLKWV